MIEHSTRTDFWEPEAPAGRFPEVKKGVYGTIWLSAHLGMFAAVAWGLGKVWDHRSPAEVLLAPRQASAGWLSQDLSQVALDHVPLLVAFLIACLLSIAIDRLFMSRLYPVVLGKDRRRRFLELLRRSREAISGCLAEDEELLGAVDVDERESLYGTGLVSLLGVVVPVVLCSSLGMSSGSFQAPTTETLVPLVGLGLWLVLSLLVAAGIGILPAFRPIITAFYASILGVQGLTLVLVRNEKGVWVLLAMTLAVAVHGLVALFLMTRWSRGRAVLVTDRRLLFVEIGERGMQVFHPAFAPVGLTRSSAPLGSAWHLRGLDGEQVQVRPVEDRLEDFLAALRRAGMELELDGAPAPVGAPGYRRLWIPVCVSLLAAFSLLSLSMRQREIGEIHQVLGQDHNWYLRDIPSDELAGRKLDLARRAALKYPHMGMLRVFHARQALRLGDLPTALESFRTGREQISRSWNPKPGYYAGPAGHLDRMQTWLDSLVEATHRGPIPWEPDGAGREAYLQALVSWVGVAAPFAGWRGNSEFQYSEAVPVRRHLEASLALEDSVAARLLYALVTVFEQPRQVYGQQDEGRERHLAALARARELLGPLERDRVWGDVARRLSRMGPDYQMAVVTALKAQINQGVKLSSELRSYAVETRELPKRPINQDEVRGLIAGFESPEKLEEIFSGFGFVRPVRVQLRPPEGDEVRWGEILSAPEAERTRWVKELERANSAGRYR